MVGNLTERQREIMLLVVSGRTNKEIAIELGVGLDTVKHHLASIYTKLDVPNRAAAAVAFSRKPPPKVGLPTHECFRLLSAR